MFKTHIEKYELIYNKMVQKYMNEIQHFLKEWEEIIKNSEDLNDNVKSFMLGQISIYLICDNWKF